MRHYNSRLPAGTARLQIFGLDVPGSPGNFDAARGPDTALRSALEYLRVVDPQAAGRIHARVAAYLPALRGTNGYGDLKESERDSLTAAIADLISLLERQRFAYIARTSREEFDWAERAAIGARQTDTWFRRMPLGWKLADGLAWTQAAMQVRDRSMADNLEWVRSRLAPRDRVLIFAASGHLASTVVQTPDAPFREMIPLGAYVRDRHGSDYIGILNLVSHGEIRYCSADPPRVMSLKAPPALALETLLGALNESRFLLDLRRAPRAVSSWLQDEHDHWNGFASFRFGTAKAFDIVYFVSPLTSACGP
jgi:erythromycin esterase-like protein